MFSTQKTISSVGRVLAAIAAFCIAVSGAANSRLAADDHPLQPAVRLVETALAKAEKIEDYTATFVKRERLDGTLMEHEFCFIKIRNEPFSVYMKFLAPEKLKGRECIYVDGRNDGNLLVRETGVLGTVVGTLALSPNGRIAMQGQKYPITNMGINNLTAQLLEDLKSEMNTPAANNQVQFFNNAKVDGRPATCITITHPQRRKEHGFYRARIFIDGELGIPIRIEGYEWPAKTGGEPPLGEEYTYRNLEVDQGLTDFDFSPQNPKYAFE